jgi:hypothetical protein
MIKHKGAKCKKCGYGKTISMKYNLYTIGDGFYYCNLHLPREIMKKNNGYTQYVSFAKG